MIGRNARGLLIGLVAAISVVFAAGAQAPTSPSVPLTPDSVQSFIASYPVVKARGEDLKAEYDVPEGMSESEAWQAWAGIGGAKSQLDETVGAYGFADITTWIGTLSSVGRAYAFARGGGDLDSKMTEALDKLENDPNIPAAQKEMIKQQLLHSSAAIIAMRPPQGNIDAVTPYIDQLDAIFDE